MKKTLTVEEKLAAAAARGGKVATKVAAAKQLSLELWPDSVRGVPNAVLRGSLFGVSQVRKTHKKRTMIAAVDGYEIRFKGETFNQTDLDTLEGMLHLARPHPLGSEVEFSVRSFLKELGRGTGKEQHEQFKEQIARLIGGVVEITSTRDKQTFIGTLVSKAKRNEVTGRYVVVFDADMLKLYQSGYTMVDWTQRQALGKNSVAKWLHGFFATHAAPFPQKVETLRTLCGSSASLFEFRRLLKDALNQLKSVGALKSWSIVADDLVKVINVPSKSQSKHLAAKKKAMDPKRV